MPEIIIVAGSNGAGKTSFASNYFADQPDLPYLNADEISHSLDIENVNHRDFRAGRLMLEQMAK